jgi:hypothetical protein
MVRQWTYDLAVIGRDSFIDWTAEFEMGLWVGREKKKWPAHEAEKLKKCKNLDKNG